ncbi:MAG: phosphatase PAP2 family protein [Bacteroidota bacterium]
MKRVIHGIFFLSFGLHTLLAQNSIISSIHQIEPTVNHYAELRTLSSNQQPSFAWMDTIAYPPELYRNNTILFALTKPIYLTDQQVGFLIKSAEHPANSSKQTRAELDFLLELQKNRTDEQVKRVLELAAIGYWPDANYVATHPSYKKNLENLFFEGNEVLGETYSYESYPKTVKLLQGIMNDMRLMEFAVKYHFLRARPYQLEAKLKPLKTISSPSFASGHTLWAYIQAYTFGELIPNERDNFVKLAYEIGLSREIMGVHYPSDEEVARQLAHRMLQLMWNTENFQNDFLKAKEEWN